MVEPPLEAKPMLLYKERSGVVECENELSSIQTMLINIPFNNSIPNIHPLPKAQSIVSPDTYKS